MLCYDIAQGQNLREDINTRVTDCTKLQADWAKEVAAARRQQLKRAGGGADGDFGGGSANKRRKSGKKGSTVNLVVLESLQNENNTESQNGDDQGTQDDDIGVLSTAREAEIEAELAQRAYRTDPLGLDRHSHRYWWLRGHPSHILVENQDGSSAGVLTTVEQIDDLLSKLNVRGPREHELHSNLKRKYSEIIAAFEEEALGEEVEGEKKHNNSGSAKGVTTTAASIVIFDVFNLPRPTPTDGRIKVKDLPALATAATTAAVSDAKEQLDAFLTETQDMGLVFAGDLKSFKRELKGVETPRQLCEYLLSIERYYATAAEGLPAGARNDELGVLLGEEEVQLLPELIALPSATAAEPEEDEEIKNEEEAEPMETDEKPKSTQVKKETKADSDKDTSDEDQEEDGDNETKATSGGGGGGGSTRGGTAATAAAAAVVDRPVTLNDEFDDSDAEHAYLREKRMRRPARLWRSPRERAVWLKLVLNAKKSATDGISNSGAQAAYCTHMLYDRGNKMLKIAAKLAEDTAKWEEAEAARAKAEAARNGAAGGANGTGAGGGSGNGNGTSGAATERPLMIRTGKFKSEEGMRIILRCMGKEPFPPGRTSTADGTTASDDVIAQCRWGYQCGVCMLAGDLLCCEHPDGCAVSVHPACTGLPFPQGQWVCSNHEDRRGKGRVRRQPPAGGGVAGVGGRGADYEAGYLSELTESEEEPEKNSEEEEDSDDDSNQSGRRSRRQSRQR
jgi:hypothetical protein